MYKFLKAWLPIVRIGNCCFLVYWMWSSFTLSNELKDIKLLNADYAGRIVMDQALIKELKRDLDMCARIRVIIDHMDEMDNKAQKRERKIVL